MILQRHKILHRVWKQPCEHKEVAGVMPTWLIQKETQIYNWLGLISVLKIKYILESICFRNFSTDIYRLKTGQYKIHFQEISSLFPPPTLIDSSVHTHTCMYSHIHSYAHLLNYISIINNSRLPTIMKYIDIKHCNCLKTSCIIWVFQRFFKEIDFRKVGKRT